MLLQRACRKAAKFKLALPECGQNYKQESHSSKKGAIAELRQPRLRSDLLRDELRVHRKMVRPFEVSPNPAAFELNRASGENPVQSHGDGVRSLDPLAGATVE